MTERPIIKICYDSYISIESICYWDVQIIRTLYSPMASYMYFNDTCFLTGHIMRMTLIREENQLDHDSVGLLVQL